MITLYLMRHGVAEDGFDTRDEERALTHEGRHKVLAAAQGLRRLGVEPDRILASPLVRAQQTAELLGSELAPNLPIETLEELRNGPEPRALLAALAAYRDAREIFLVGHQPSLGELASQLLTGSPLTAPLPFKKGAIAAIGLGALPPKGPGILRWFAPVRMIAGRNSMPASQDPAKDE